MRSGALVYAALFTALLSLAHVPGARAGPSSIFCLGGLEQVPQIPADHVVELWYLEAPVFKARFQDWFGDALKAFHTGIGLKDLTSGMNYTVEYDAVFEVPNATFPRIVREAGNVDLRWLNAGKVCIMPTIDYGYWDWKRTQFATVNGTVFNQYMSWTAQDNITHDVYQVFNVFDHYHGKQYVEASTCTEFVWRSFDRFATLGVSLNFTETPKHTLVNLYSGVPELVDFEDDTHHAEVVRYYETFHGVSNLMEFFKHLELLLEVDKFLYVHGNYYRLSYHWPPLAGHYEHVPVPGDANYVPQPEPNSVLMFTRPSEDGGADGGDESGAGSESS